MPQSPRPTARLRCEMLEARDVPAAWAAASLVGSLQSSLALYDNPGGVAATKLTASGAFRDSIRVAMGDVTGDGVWDVAVGSGWTVGIGPGPPTVDLYDGVVMRNPGLSITPFRTITAYSPAALGVNVALADLDGDGRAELITAPDGAGAAPHAKVFAGSNGALVASFFAFDPGKFTSGADVAVGDVTGDGRADVTFAARRKTGWQSTEYRVAVYAGQPPATMYLPATASHTMSVATNVAGDTAPELRVRVAVGRADGDARADVLLGLASGYETVTVYSGDALAGQNVARSLGRFTAPGRTGSSGLRMVCRDVDGNGLSEVVFGSAPGQADAVWVGSAGGLLAGVPVTKAAAPFASNYARGIQVG